MAENSVSTPQTDDDQRPAHASPAELERGLAWPRYVLSAIILLSGVAVCIGLSKLKQDSKEQDSEKLVPLVSIEAIQPFAGELDMTVSGSVVPFREIRVSAKVSGNVVKKHPKCEAGHFVKAGEPLIEIDPSDFQNQLEIANAELDQSKKLLSENELEISSAADAVKLATRDYQIAKSEFERSKRIRSALSKAEFDQASRNKLSSEGQLSNRKNELKLVRKRIDRLQASIRLSESRVAAAQTNLERATVVSPDDGMIVSEAVQEGDFVAVGNPLFTFEDTRQSEVVCNLSPRDLTWIRENSTLSNDEQQQIDQNPSLAAYYLPNTDVAIYEPDLKNVIWEGKLARFDGVGRDNLSRTIPTLITVADPIVKTENGTHALVRGMYVKCKIKIPVSAGDADRQFLAFPALALRPGNFVWTVKDNHITKVPVEIIDRIEVGSGDRTQKIIVIRGTTTSLQPGTEVVVSPIPQAVDGMKVQLKTEIDDVENTADAAVESLVDAEEANKNG